VAVRGVTSRASGPSTERKGRRSRVRLVLACAALVLLVAAVYGRVARNAFIDYDDPAYVTDNAHVQAGLTPATAAWAFTTGFHANWHPLTWLSHALDCEIFGLDPAGHHLVSAALHALNAMLLLLALYGMTKALWRSAFVAALFAVHPLHVESVAWAAERKDVLSTFFAMLVLLAYARQVERPSKTTRVLVPALFALGLLAKPMLVTLPFVLVLLDYWPLERFGEAAARGFRRWIPPCPLIVEKLPLFALAAASAAVTWIVQQRGGAVTALDALPLSSRLANAAVAYVGYLGRMFWPVGLGVLYPIEASIPAWKVLGAIALLAAITGAVVRGARRAPYLVTGWFWYVGTLVPVIGLVQVGLQSSADRYTYVPLVGIFVMIAWGVPDLVSAVPARRAFLGGAAACVLAACSLLTFRQIGYWQDSTTLFEHTISVTTGNYVVENNLGGVLMREGRLDDAIRHLARARSIRPDHAATLSNLGLAMQRKGKLGEAIALYREALHFKPTHLEAWLNLGNALEQTGDFDGALSAYAQAGKLDPEATVVPQLLARASEGKRRAAASPNSRTPVRPEALTSYERANALRDQGRLADAEAAYREAIRLDPAFAGARINLGIALAMRGVADEAASQLSEAIRLDPGDASAHYNLGALLARQGRTTEAKAQFEETLRISPGHAGAKRALDDLRNLGTATVRHP
jgi:protein O-mannosyl-transferase